MNRMTRWTSLLLAGAMTLSLAACGGKENPGSSTPGSAGSSPSEIGYVENATYRQLYSSEVTSFNYLYTSNTNDLQMSANSVDCLVEYDPHGVIIPSLAERWEPNEDNTVWTFHIRPDVKWVDYQGNEVADVTANDWVSAAEWVNNAANEAANQYMYDGIVQNAQAYYEYTAYLVESQDGTRTVNDEGEEIKVVAPVDFADVGVKAIDELTLEFTMESPCPYFPSVLGYGSYMPVYGPFLEEMGENFGAATGPDTILYNGAFLLSEFEPQNRRRMVKNPTYWDKDQVFIEGMEWTYNNTADTLGPEMFVRGEVDWTQLDASLLNAWLSDVGGKRDMVSPSRPSVSYSYFYAFNFEPRFDSSLEPDNWVKAVNNENFRQSLFHGLDRVNAVTVYDPQNPQGLLTNTITPPTFANAGGLDFTQYPALKAITEGDSFDETVALSYKEKAVEELTAAGATFPVKVYMRYNPSTTNWDKECQIVEQQLEALLGSDYIDVVVEAGPSTNFLSMVRRTGDFGLMTCNWGADYADPQTWTDSFAENNTYNFMNQDPSRSVADQPCDNKSEETQALVAEYYELVNKAKAITNDDSARYTAFAQAEAFLIEHALVLPFHISTDGYLATRLNVFEAQYAPYGLALQRFKYQHIMEKPMSMEQYNALYADWQATTSKAVADAG